MQKREHFYFDAVLAYRFCAYMDMKCIPLLESTVIFKVTLLALFYVVCELDPEIHLDCRRTTRNIGRKLLLGKEARGAVHEEKTGS